MRTITLKAKLAFKEKYRSLLSEDWSMASLRQVLGLLDELLRASHAALRFSWEESESAFRGGKRVIDLEDLTGLLAIHRPLGLPGIPVPPDALGELLAVPNGEVTLAVRAWVYLDLQALFELRGETDFLRDLQSILFLNVIEALLPGLHAAGLSEFHGILIHALGYHNAVVWRDDPAHQQYLLSAWAHYLGNRDLEENALRAAFRLTDPGEHDYLTLAQSYWQFLMDDRRYEDAERFLLGVYRQAPREHLDEIKGLIDDTYAERGLLHA
jgi:hypothetical protein